MRVERFADKIALVTGASRGIGRGIALRLASEGADLVVNYRSHREEAQELADEIAALGRRALLCQADVADRAAIRQMFDQALERFGRIDIAVANAAMSVREPVIEARWEHVLRTIEVSQFGVFHTCQMAAQQMVRQGGGGKIIIISSVHEEIAVPNSAAYNMAKAAINHLCRTMAAELAGQRINVNVINPGWIDTPGERAFASEQELQAGGKRIPWGRMGTPADIAGAVAFLASDDADYITGAMLRVDGGFKLGLSLPES
jgi:glucose 1-dehydrogenase